MKKTNSTELNFMHLQWWWMSWLNCTWCQFTVMNSLSVPPEHNHLWTGKTRRSQRIRRMMYMSTGRDCHITCGKYSPLWKDMTLQDIFIPRQGSIFDWVFSLSDHWSWVINDSSICYHWSRFNYWYSKRFTIWELSPLHITNISPPVVLFNNTCSVIYM